MNVVSFGSCLSYLTSVELKLHYQCTFKSANFQNRSDSFVAKYIDKTESLPPYDLFNEQLQYVPEHEAESREVLENQYLDRMGKNAEGCFPFLETLQNDKIDIIVLDNFFDIAGMLFRVDKFFDPPPFDVFLNFHHYTNDLTKWGRLTDFMDQAEAARNWVKLCRWLRSYQPHAKIFLLSFQVCQSIRDADRYVRGKRFFDEIVKVMPEDLNVDIFPAIDVEETYHKGYDDWAHFTPTVYKALAGTIFLKTVGNLPPFPRDYVQTWDRNIVEKALAPQTS